MNSLRFRAPPPGPPAWVAGKHLVQFPRDPLGFFQELAQTYGDLVYFQLGPQPLVLLSEPELIRSVLLRDHALFYKGRVLEAAKDLLGEGLLTSEGDFHARQRRIIQPLFHRQMIRQYAATMVNYGERFRNRWQTGQTLDICQEMMKLTLSIVGQTLFNSDVEQEAKHVGEAMHTVLVEMNLVGKPLMMLTRRLPTPKRRRFLAAKAILDQTIAEIIQKQKNTPDQTHLVAMLLNARDHEGDQQGMSETQIRDEALTLFLAGHETTANALAWTWYLLSQHPRAEARLHQELDKVLGGRLPTVDDLPDLVYTRQVMTESMRLFPPAWTIARRALEPYTFDNGYQIPAGGVILMSQYLVHRHPRFYPEAGAFIPERWEKNYAHTRPKFAYFPFGGGPRNCIGEAFAWMEGILLIATLAQKWRFNLVKDHPVVPEPLITLRPKYGLKMILEAR